MHREIRATLPLCQTILKEYPQEECRHRVSRSVFGKQERYAVYVHVVMCIQLIDNVAFLTLQEIILNKLCGPSR